MKAEDLATALRLLLVRSSREACNEFRTTDPLDLCNK
jgi:hypothetical protein